MSDVRVRMAPSPTGWIHVGTARTYLMTQIFALQQDGKNILRIEDTDSKRSVKGGVEGIIDSLSLLDIVADEGPVVGGDYGPYIQTQRLDIYKKYAEKLVEDGKAYYCFCTPERLEKLGKEQEANKERRGYDGHCRNLSKEEIAEKLEEGIDHTIRLKVPKDEVLEFTDLIQGDVKFNSNEVNDQVLMKSNGIPTYHLAVVVDDHLMKISHIHRGVEWLSSTPKQILLFKALGWDMPTFVHVPLLLNATGPGKLSKRKGDVAVLDFFRKGYIKEGLINYLMLIGWSPAPEVAREDEIYDFEFFVKNFDHSRIKKSSGRFQVDKMTAFNAKWIAKLSVDNLLDRFSKWFKVVLEDTVVDSMRGVTELLEEQRDKVLQIKSYFENNTEKTKSLIELLQPRIKLLTDSYELLEVLWQDIPKYDYASIDKVVPEIEKSEEIAYNLRVALEKLDTWNQEPWEMTIRALADQYGLPHGKMFMILRIIVAGKKVSLPLREFMEIVGRDFVAKRFDAFVR